MLTRRRLVVNSGYEVGNARGAMRRIGAILAQGRRSWVFSGSGDKTLGDWRHLGFGAPQSKKLLSSSGTRSITGFTKDVFYWLLLNMQGQRRLGQRSIHILYRVFRWNNQLDVQYCVHNNYSYINQYCFIVDNYLFLISLFTCSLSFHTSLDIWTTIATMTLNIHYQSILADIVYVSIFLQSHSVYVLLYTETIYGIYSLWLILVVIPLE